MGKNGNFRLTRLERNWILYDVGNSAFVLMVATLIPIFFNALAESGGLTSVEYLAYWGYASSVVTIIKTKKYKCMEGLRNAAKEVYHKYLNEE